MEKHNLNYLPVKKNETVIGILSRYDVTTQLQHHKYEEGGE